MVTTVQRRSGLVQTYQSATHHECRQNTSMGINKRGVTPTCHGVLGPSGRKEQYVSRLNGENCSRIMCLKISKSRAHGMII